MILFEAPNFAWGVMGIVYDEQGFVVVQVLSWISIVTTTSLIVATAFVVIRSRP
jgi:hypothetical protein